MTFVMGILMLGVGSLMLIAAGWFRDRQRRDVVVLTEWRTVLVVPRDRPRLSAPTEQQLEGALLDIVIELQIRSTGLFDDC